MDLTQPRISANELGNFIFTTDAGRRRILKGQRFPSPIVVSRYQSASAAILRSLDGNIFSEKVLADELKKLSLAPVASGYQAKVRAANIRAIKRFLPIAEKAAPPAGEHSIIRRNASFEFEGVLISVRPDILTKNLDDKFFTYSKLRFSSHKYSSDASEIVLLLIQKYAELQIFEGLGFDVSRAQMIDCFSQQVFQAHHVSPYKGSLLMKALKDIRGAWPFISKN